MAGKNKANRMGGKWGWVRLPPFIWCVLLLAGTGTGFLRFIPDFPLWRLAAAGVVIAVALLWLLYCLVSFRRHHTSPDPRHMPQNLITDGPFRISRNPIYCGLAALMAGAGIFLGFWEFIVTTSLFIILVTVTNIVPEEKVLEACYGERYQRYKARVRRWL